MKNIAEKAHDAAAYLKGFANPHRLSILCSLTEGEKSVSVLIEDTGLAQTSMSQHLSKLKKEHIITYRRDHRTLYYRIEDETALAILRYLYEAFCKEKDT